MVSDGELTVSDSEPDTVAEFSKFYAKNVARLVAFLIRAQGLRINDAADCAQETLIAALQSWETIHKPYPWCRTVASRKAKDFRGGQLESPLADPPETARSALLADAVDVEAFEEKAELARWLAHLGSDKQRLVLAMTFDDASTLEIAAELNMNPATVRSTLRNARAALRRVRDGNGEHQ